MNLGYRWFARIACCAFLALVGSITHAQSYVFGTASYSAPGGGFSSSLVTADFNADGIADVAILGSTSNGKVLSIFLGQPGGSFAPRVDYSIQAASFPVGDYNGDGKVDIVTSGDPSYPLVGVNILYGNGDGTFQSP